MRDTSKSLTGISPRELRRQRRARMRMARQLRWRHRLKRLVRAILAVCAIFVAALVFANFSGGLGSGGIILTFFAMAAVFVIVALFPRTRSFEVNPDPATDLTTLVGQTQSWLERQRGKLPAKTQTLVDLLESRLEDLSPRLGTLSDSDPAAYELRKLLGEHVPSLINSYTSIPTALTHQPNAGSTPAAQLHAGLETVAREVERVGNTIASGELDALATRGRYLDARYSSEGEGPV
ncbi:MAG TPA: hypothetical protein VF481_21505, partial [Novosphingobium sp.]